MKRAIFISAFLLVLAVCAIFIIPLNIPAASAENTGSASTIKSPEEEIADKMESLVATAQAIVDAPDSAWLGDSFVGQIIGDHASQGFDALYACTEGTRAYMDYGAYRPEYICVGVEQSYNLDTDTTDELNNSVNYKNAGGIRCETCNDSKGVSITIAYVQPVR